MGSLEQYTWRLWKPGVYTSYETINVHLKRKPDWLLARNPKGRVPVLEFSDGRIVFESVITCQYLDDVYPQEPLTPADPYQKARDRLFVDYCDKFMMAIYQLWSSDSNNKKGKATIHVGMQMYEQELTQRNSGPFFGGNKPTMLDYLIWPWFERLSPFVNPEVMPHHSLTKNRNTELTYQRGTGALQYPRLQRWMSFMVKLPAVKATMFDLHMHHSFGRSQIAGFPFPPLTPGILRLYSMRFCPYAQRTRLVLAHKNIPYETINVHLKRKPDWLLARNPKGRVPVLEFSDGRIVFESVITCQYLDDVYPQEPLTPADPYQKARDRLFVDYCDKFMMAIYQLWSSDSNSEKGKATIHVGMQMYEQELTQRNSGPFFGGNKPTMLDYLIWPWFERLSPFVNPEVMPHHSLTKNRNTELTYQRATGALQYPRLQRWMSFMVKLPAVKATMFDLHMHHSFGRSQIAGDPDYDVGLNDEPPFPHSQL